MPVVKLTITGLSETLKALDLDLQAAAPTIGVAVAEAVRNIAAPYPQVRRERQPFKSAKSRAYFFAALRDGKITVPYRRSGVAGRSWVVEPTANGADLTNNAPAAKYVYNAQTQASYHKGNWTTEMQAAAEAEAQGIPEKAAEAAINDLIRKAGGS